MLYSSGKHIAQDHKKAVEWYGKAANKGHRYAQYGIASKYRQGEGEVEKNLVLSYMWFTIAKLNGEVRYGDDGNGRRYKKDMTSSQVQEAESLAEKWIKNH